MSRPLFLSLLIYALLLAGMLTVKGALLAVALPLVTYLLAGYLRAPEKLSLQVTHHLSAERVSPDTDVQVTVTVTSRGSSLEEVLLMDVVPEGLAIRSGFSRHLVTLKKDEPYTFAYTVHGPRGGYVFEAIEAEIRDRLAVTGSHIRVQTQGRLFVLPPVTRIRQVTIRPRRTLVYAGAISARAGGTGTDFFGVREYRPGDPPRAINWRASARYADKFYANEFQQERVADVGIVLDGRLRTNEFARGHSLFEYSVQAAASVADALLSQGNRVGLLIYATYLAWTFPGYGKIQRERILHALANAQAGESQVFSDLEHIPTRLFPPKSQIILLSPLVDEDLMPLIQLRAQGYEVMVLSPDPVRFELSYLPRNETIQLAGRVIRMERALLLQKMGRAGIHVLDWDVAEPFDHFVRRRLSRSPFWLQAFAR